MYGEEKCRITFHFSSNFEAGNEQVMTYWMKKLLEPDSGLKELMPVRIHSMNVLRALFRDATFSHPIMEWVPEGIQLAFRGLRAKEWAVSSVTHFLALE